MLNMLLSCLADEHFEEFMDMHHDMLLDYMLAYLSVNEELLTEEEQADLEQGIITLACKIYSTKEEALKHLTGCPNYDPEIFSQANC